MKRHQALNSVPPMAREQKLAASAQAMKREKKTAMLLVIARAELVALLARSLVLK